VTRWNAAIEAYDQDLEVIEEVRDEYAAHLRAIFDQLHAKLPAMAGASWTAQTTGTGPKTTWTAVPAPGSPATLSVWTARAFGGPVATLLVGLELNEGSGFAPDARATRRKLLVEAAEQAVDGVPGGPPDAASHGDIALTVVRVAATSMKDRPVHGVGAIIEAYATLAATLNDLVAVNRWLAESLEAIPLAKTLPPGVPSDAEWCSGRYRGANYVQLDTKDPTRCVWVAARPPGELLLGHYFSDIHASLLKTLGAREHCISDDREKVVLLLDSAQVEALHHAQDVESVRSTACEALRGYFRVAEAASS